jgi:hemerythrin-like metal-binding protein
MKANAVRRDPCPAALQIYREHQDVLESLEKFRGAVQLRRPERELKKKLAEFVSTVEKHFASEEGLMRSGGYQGAGAHAAEHRRLFGQIRSVTEEFAAGAINPGGALALFVEVWTTQHIERQDNRFIEFLDAQSVAAR